MSLIHIKVVSPQRVLVEADVEQLSLPTTMGQITILSGHAPLISDIHSGELTYVQQGQVRSIHIAGGVVEVHLHNQVILLADEAEHPEEIDVAQIEAAKLKAVKALTETVLSDEEYATVAMNLERSLSRLRFVRKHGHRGGMHVQENPS